LSIKGYKGVLAVFNDENKGVYYIAEDENIVISSLLTTYEWSDWRNKITLWIQSVYVLPDYRNKGIFKMMYQYVKNFVEKSNKYTGIRLYVDKTNKIAQSVYEKIGMNGNHYSTFEWMKSD
jgi:ribosomal protein S18 acetylase RimI-like enzyme